LIDFFASAASGKQDLMALKIYKMADEQKIEIDKMETLRITLQNGLIQVQQLFSFQLV
jgi:hypothetical protein